jgi:hypothetical protein
MPIDVEKFKHLTSENKNLKADFKPLNFQKLLETGAFRVTHRGLDGGAYDPDPKAGFSLVSAYNDAVGEATKNWKNNETAYPAVMDLFRNRPQDIGVHKYLQIINSAKQLGLSDNDIYLNTQKFSLPSEYSDGGRVSFI